MTEHPTQQAAPPAEAPGDLAPPAWRRGAALLRRTPPAAVLAALLVLHGGLQAWWIHLDRSVGSAMQTSFMTPVADLLAHRALGMEHPPQAFLGTGWLPWAGVLLHDLLGSTNPDVLLWTILLCVLATQLLLARLGQRLGGAWAGVLLAGLYPLVPEIAMQGRRWAVMVPQHACLAGAALCLVASRSLTRPLPSLGFLAFTAAALTVVPLGTEAMLVIPALAGMALGAGLRGLILGTGPLEGQRVARWRVLVVGGLTAALFLLAIHATGLIESEATRIGEEAYSDRYTGGFPASHPLAWSAYLRYLGAAGLSPLVALAAMAGVGVLLRRGQGRAELLGWVALPLLAFSVLAKKNPYYVHTVMPALAAVAMVGLVRWRRFGPAAAGLTVLLAGLQWYALSFPWVALPVLPGPLGVHLPSAAAQVFQSPGQPTLGPALTWEHEPPWELLVTCAAGGPSQGPIRVELCAGADLTDAHLAAALGAPRLSWRNRPGGPGQQTPHCVVVEHPDCLPEQPIPPLSPSLPWAAAAEIYQDSPRFAVQARRDAGHTCWTLHRRSAATAPPAGER